MPEMLPSAVSTGRNSQESADAATLEAVSDNFYSETTQSPPNEFDVSLRPPDFDEFRGQEKVKERLMLMVEAAKQRGDALDHVLLCGPPGLGKTTLAQMCGSLNRGR